MAPLALPPVRPATAPGKGWARRCVSDEHSRAVDRVVAAMRARFDEPLSLDDLARIAVQSPFHFNRVFRRKTGVPPVRFLAALRMAEAKRLLLTTDLSVTDVCHAVGYRSLGTFSTHFTELVGVPPRVLRHLGGEPGRILEHALDEHRNGAGGAVTGPVLRGEVTASRPLRGPIFVGAFSTPVPQGRPAGCTLLTAPRTFELEVPRPGGWHVCATTFPPGTSWIDYLLPDEASLLVASTEISATAGAVAAPAEPLRLRRVRPTDPPILVALPFLLDGWAEAQSPITVRGGGRA
jgi:AraC family transcriptional regulator